MLAPMTFLALLKRPSAFLPVVMSLAALAVIAVAFSRHGVTYYQQSTDEGTPAHLWQLLMGLQLPIVAFFALRWLPRAPRLAVLVLAIHVVAGLAALAPVYYFHL